MTVKTSSIANREGASVGRSSDKNMRVSGHHHVFGPTLRTYMPSVISPRGISVNPKRPRRYTDGSPGSNFVTGVDKRSLRAGDEFTLWSLNCNTYSELFAANAGEHPKFRQRGYIERISRGNENPGRPPIYAASRWVNPFVS